MKLIRLNKVGGIAGKRSSASVSHAITEAEWNELLQHITIAAPPVSKRKKDAQAYTLQADDETAVLIDPNRVPEKFHALFRALFAGLEPAE